MSIMTVNVCTHASLSEWLAEYICDSDMMNNYSSLMVFDGIDFGEEALMPVWSIHILNHSMGQVYRIIA